MLIIGYRYVMIDKDRVKNVTVMVPRSVTSHLMTGGVFLKLWTLPYLFPFRF